MSGQLSIFSPSEPSRMEPALPLPGAAALVPSLTDELAAVWGLPLGRKVRVELRHHTVTGLSGMLRVAGLPDLPFDRLAPLRLRIGDVEFSSRQVAAWSVVD